MKLFSLQENLKQGLAIVSHIATKNINLPILNNILIAAENNNIELISTNLEIGIIHSIRGKVEKGGSITIDSKLITDYINLLPKQKVELGLEAGDLKIECDNYKTKIKSLSAEDFPLIPNVDKEYGYKVELKEFKKALSQVVFAVSTSETRLELSGVLFSFNNNKLTIAATDSYRLAEKTVNIKGNEKGVEKKVIIPARTLQELIRILSLLAENGEQLEEIDFFLTENQIMFEFKNTKLVSKIIEGQYPDYKQIIPSSNKTIAIVNREELIRAIKASALFSKSGINDVNLDFPKGKNKMVVSSTSGQSGESVVELNVESSGDDNGIIVNYRYLLDGLNNIEKSEVKIEINNNNTPCIVKPQNVTDYLYIVMPIRQ